MYRGEIMTTRKITNDLIYVGGSDTKEVNFENFIPTERGMAYNSYLLLDKKTVLFDTVDRSISNTFFENLEHALEGRSLDYLFITHMEPDHSDAIEELLLRHPEVTIVLNLQSLKMLNNFMGKDMKDKTLLVNPSSEFSSGKHSYQFINAPFVHWPEVMFIYDKFSKVLFSADTFGSFGANFGNLFDDEITLDEAYFVEQRRYYANVIGKYGEFVQKALASIKDLDIETVCPLHGVVWRSNFDLLLKRYNLWSQYLPESNDVILIYNTLYNHTSDLCYQIASQLAEKGVKNIKMYDVSKTELSFLVSEVFRVQNILLAATTYNAGLYPPMKNFLNDILALNVQNKNVALIENGTWGPVSGKIVTEKLNKMKDINILNTPVKLMSKYKAKTNESGVNEIVDKLVELYNK